MCYTGQWPCAILGSGHVLYWAVAMCYTGQWPCAILGSGWAVAMCYTGQWPCAILGSGHGASIAGNIILMCDTIVLVAVYVSVINTRHNLYTNLIPDVYIYKSDMYIYI